MTNGLDQATFATSALAIGNHPITAVYGGDTNFLTSTSAGVPQLVNQDATTAEVTVTPWPSAFGQTVTFTATVAANAPGAGTPSGTVTFMDGTVALGTVPLSGGVAALATAQLAVGSHLITAAYSGDANYLGSTSIDVGQAVLQASTSTVVTSNANPSVVGQAAVFTATVALVGPGGHAHGNGGVLLRRRPVGLGPTWHRRAGDADDSAVGRRQPHRHGVYSGDANFGTSTSGSPLTQTVLFGGDANRDGQVDIEDLTILLTNFGKTGMTWEQGNFDGDPTVDIEDLTILLTNFGRSVGPPAVSVGNAGTVGFVRGGTPVAVAPSLAVTDPESYGLTSATVAISGGPLDAGAELLSAVTAGTNITASYNGTAGILTLSGVDTLANYQQVLQSMTYVRHGNDRHAGRQDPDVQRQRRRSDQRGRDGHRGCHRPLARPHDADDRWRRERWPVRGAGTRCRGGKRGQGQPARPKTIIRPLVAAAPRTAVPLSYAAAVDAVLLSEAWQGEASS